MGSIRLSSKILPAVSPMWIPSTHIVMRAALKEIGGVKKREAPAPEIRAPMRWPSMFFVLLSGCLSFPNFFPNRWDVESPTERISIEAATMDVLKNMEMVNAPRI